MAARLTVIVAVAVAIAACGTAAAAGRARNPRLAHIHTLALAIGSGDLGGDLAARYSGYDLVVVDGEEATARQVKTLRAGGRRLVLAYLDVGTIEPGRSWFGAAKPFRLDFWPDFGEWYADTSKPGLRRLITDRVAPAMLAKRFDGLFLDNTDMIETHPRQSAGMRTLVRALAARVHARGGVLFAQNGDASIGPLLGVLDGWNREDVSYTYDFARRDYAPVAPADRRAALGALRRIRARGLLVSAVDYTRAGDAAAIAGSLTDACAAGAVPFVSDIGLTRIAQPPLRCR
jgi:polysaccharide biosynthesis protein PelA